MQSYGISKRTQLTKTVSNTALRAFLLLLITATAFAQLPTTASQQSKIPLGQNSQNQFQEPLPVDEAFMIFAQRTDSGIKVEFQITLGHYLYLNRSYVQFANQSAKFPKGELQNDEFFGTSEVTYDNFAVHIDLESPATPEQQLEIKYQGCSDIGYCYPPLTIKTPFNKLTFAPKQLFQQQIRTTSIFTTNKDTTNSAPIAGNDLSMQDMQSELQTSEDIELFNFLLEERYLAILGFLALGILLAFTPCVLPVLPILTAVVTGQAKPRSLRSIKLALAYVMGLAMTFAIFGLIFGLLGVNFQIQLQQAPFIILFSTILAIAALFMFGIVNFNFAVTSKMKTWFNSKLPTEANTRTAFLLGIVGALFSGPCVSPAIAGALIYISATADMTLGAMALGAVGFGMGLPLIALSAAYSSFIPKTGTWMLDIKKILGFCLLFTAIWILERSFHGVFTLSLWILCATILGVWIVKNFSKQTVIVRVLSLLLLGITLWYSLIEQDYSNNKLDSVWEGYVDPAKINKSLADTSQPVILEITADWCFECQVFKRDLKQSPKLQKLLANYKTLQLDVSDFDDEKAKFLQKYRLVGPPAILFFDNNTELQQLRIIGAIQLELLEQRIQSFAKIVIKDTVAN